MDITKPVLEEYCSRHGYELHIKEVEPYQKYNGLHKLGMIEYLQNGDVGMFMDCDTLITNLTIKIESILNDYHYLYLSDGLNLGVFILDNGGSINAIIKRIINKIKEEEYHCEQDAIEDYYNKDYFNNMATICRHPCFNSYLPELYGHIPNPEEITAEKGRWEVGQFICHLPALSMETRIEKLKELKEKIVR